MKLSCIEHMPLRMACYRKSLMKQKSNSKNVIWTNSMHTSLFALFYVLLT